MSESSKLNGESLAFPTEEYTFYNGVPAVSNQHFGMTKREVMAKDFMASLLSKYALSKPDDQKIVACLAVELADALLEALG